MKRVTAYVSTTRVQQLAGELIAVGVKEIRVIEHFLPTSQISRLQLCCRDDLVGRVREIIRSVGTTGKPPDYDLVVSDFDPNAPSQIPLGKRMSALEEPQLAARIRSLFKGATTRLTLVFLAITLSIVAVGVFTHIRLVQYRSAVKESAENVRSVIDAAGSIQVVHLEELLAAERLHRGEGERAFRDFNAARERMGAAVSALQQSRLISQVPIDSLVVIEDRFQSITDGMFGLLTRLSIPADTQNARQRARLTQAHADLMVSLDTIHEKCMALLASLEKTAGEVSRRNEIESDKALNEVRLSLTILAAAATTITALMWLVTRTKVAVPLRILVEAARALDDGELK
ncbi:MAG: hypothetical protein AB1428_02580 [Bacteroidota bacterium]